MYSQCAGSKLIKLLSLSTAVVQWTKRKTRKTEEVSSNLNSISFYFNGSNTSVGEERANLSAVVYL